MKLSRKLALAVLPLAAVLAGCQSTGSKAPAQEAQTQQEQQVQQPVQVASVEVFAASEKEVKGYRPVKLSEKQTIYVAQKPVFDRTALQAIEPLQDNKGRTFIRLQLNEAGVNALKAVPEDRGFVTVVGGQVASLSGFRDGNSYIFMVRDVQAAQAITAAVVGPQAMPKAQSAKQ